MSGDGANIAYNYYSPCGMIMFLSILNSVILALRVVGLSGTPLMRQIVEKIKGWKNMAKQCSSFHAFVGYSIVRTPTSI